MVKESDSKLLNHCSALLGLFIPAVTDIMAGSNRSASLRDTQTSIPVGTLSAIGCTTVLYVVSVFIIGAVATREVLLVDRALMGLFFPAVTGIMAGSNRSASLRDTQKAIPTGTLSAIGASTVLYVVSTFLIGAVAVREAPDGTEPNVATLFTMLICCGCVVIGNLDYITPVITMFFLLCYCGVNLSCFLLDLLDAPSWRPRWKWHHWAASLAGAILCIVIMFMISWGFTIVSLALAALIYYYVGKKGKAATAVHPKNWYPIPLIFCKPWGILPQDVPCHPKLADFANCMKKKGRGMSLFVSILEGPYKDKVEESRHASRLLATYIDYKNCEGVAEVVVAPDMRDGFRAIVQCMGLANLKPNIVCLRYPEIWRNEGEGHNKHIPDTFVSIINDCSVANKACVIVKGLDEWPGEFQKQYGTIDLYWIVRDGGIMLLLSQLLRAKESFESCRIQVFCIADEDSEAEEFTRDVRKFLYDLRMQAEVIVVTMKSWEEHKEDQEADPARAGTLEAFSKARKRIMAHVGNMSEGSASNETLEYRSVSEEKVNKFIYTAIKLNSIIMRYSRAAAVVLVSLPPPPHHHPSYCYMEYMDLLVDGIPRLLMVRGYRRDVRHVLNEAENNTITQKVVLTDASFKTKPPLIVYQSAPYASTTQWTRTA
eukprot:SM000060S19634  [mRNA]  locus=s60:225036:230284:- [translate_table: standard]